LFNYSRTLKESDSDNRQTRRNRMWMQVLFSWYFIPLTFLCLSYVAYEFQEKIYYKKYNV